MNLRDEKDLLKKVHEVHLFVAGNDQYGQKGLKHLIEDHAKRLDTLEGHKKSEWRTIAKAGGVGGAIGGALGILFPKIIITKVAAFLAGLFI